MRACVFCQIICKEINASIIFENEDVCCFLDRQPINPGHLLVVPKKHEAMIFEAEERYLHALISTAQKSARVLKKHFNPDGVIILQENGIDTDVDHIHMHVFPRFENDGFRIVEPMINKETLNFHSLQRSLKEVWKTA
ncbi:HIT family protein [Virgibacillus sp. MG-45]|uniref:HIT family protein n=1 Tax=Virgibacillus sp. MG-45 TaxID=3102791 RepID=UPI002EDB5929